MRIVLLSNAKAVHTQRWARAYAERGQEVHVLSIRHYPIPGLQVQRVGVGPADSTSAGWAALSYLRLGLSLRRRLRRLRPDVVQACYAPTHGVLAALAGYRPWVLSVWGSDVVGVARRARALRRRWTRFAVAGADRVCATSRFLADETRQLVDRPVAITPFGVDLNHFRPAARRRQPADELVVGYAKTLAPRYGTSELLHAVAALRRRDVPVRLLIMGRDESGGAFRRLAASLGLGDRVTFAGFVPHAELPSRFAEIDVLANPSVCEESFGVSILEASAAGLPVVASATGGIPEVCLHGETGLLTPPGDVGALAAALERLARDPGEARALGAAGRCFVSGNYSWDDCVRRMLAELVAAREGGG